MELSDHSRTITDLLDRNEACMNTVPDLDLQKRFPAEKPYMGTDSMVCMVWVWHDMTWPTRI